MRKLVAYLQDELAYKKFHRVHSTSEIMSGFLTISKLKLSYLHLDHRFKVGIVNWTGQTSDEDIWDNTQSSSDFNKFVESLGRKIDLQNWSGYAGGLDTTSRCLDGREALHALWEDAEIVFHVSTYLQGAHQKKVHIGNDAVVIVFRDTKEPFSPSYVQSKFNRKSSRILSC